MWSLVNKTAVYICMKYLQWVLGVSHYWSEYFSTPRLWRGGGRGGCELTEGSTWLRPEYISTEFIHIFMICSVPSGRGRTFSSVWRRFLNKPYHLVWRGDPCRRTHPPTGGNISQLPVEVKVFYSEYFWLFYSITDQDEDGFIKIFTSEKCLIFLILFWNSNVKIKQYLFKYRQHE